MSHDVIGIIQLVLSALVAEIPLIAMLISANSKIVRLETQMQFLLKAQSVSQEAQANHWRKQERTQHAS